MQIRAIIPCGTLLSPLPEPTPAAAVADLRPGAVHRVPRHWASPETVDTSVGPVT